ncbi:MAG TPA: hypothetical protein VFC63_08915 [Blastocatellia bacterium]|nr:hypothetical protein [Blastocatellia bacterium]
MATVSSAVLATHSQPTRQGFLRLKLGMLKSLFSPTTTPEPMSETDVQKYLYPDRPSDLVDCRIIDSSRKR